MITSGPHFGAHGQGALCNDLPSDTAALSARSSLKSCLAGSLWGVDSLLPGLPQPRLSRQRLRTLAVNHLPVMTVHTVERRAGDSSPLSCLLGVVHAMCSASLMPFRPGSDHVRARATSQQPALVPSRGCPAVCPLGGHAPRHPCSSLGAPVSTHSLGSCSGNGHGLQCWPVDARGICRGR